jgi:hypothetical protein
VDAFTYTFYAYVRVGLEMSGVGFASEKQWEVYNQLTSDGKDIHSVARKLKKLAREKTELDWKDD